MTEAEALEAAEALARRYCGWHVTPVQTDTVTLDGPGGRLLVLPTLKLVELTSLTEDGETVDLDQVSVSRRGVVRKNRDYPVLWPSGYCWTSNYGGIVATMSHGFTEAPDWEDAIRSYTERAMFAVAGGFRESVGPFSFQAATNSVGSAFSDAEKAVLDLYKLESAP